MEKQGFNRDRVQISEQVVATIAALEAVDADGVAGMSGGIAGGIAELLGRKNLTRGVKAYIEEKQCTIDIFVVVYFGVRIPCVSFAIQDRVKKAVEQMAGLQVSEVNIHIQGVIQETEDEGK